MIAMPDALQPESRLGQQNDILWGELVRLFLEGETNTDEDVRRMFRISNYAAAQAMQINANAHLILAALLTKPCQWMFAGVKECWTADSLLETGTYDWLLNAFGSRVAEPIRLQSNARRYLATAVPKHYRSMTLDEQKLFFQDGGYMTDSETDCFWNNRFRQSALDLLAWCDTAPSPHFESISMCEFLETGLHL
jgi:predicted HD phosphohydrolase